MSWYRRIWKLVQNEPQQAPDFRIHDGLLYKHILHRLDYKEVDPDDQWKRCVPKDERPELLRRYHDAPAAEHLGIAKTIARIAEQHY